MVSPTTSQTMLLSARIVAMALAIVVPLGTFLGYALARWKRRGALSAFLRVVVDGLVTLPLVLPPSVTGYALLVLLGRHSFFGMFLERVFGVRLVFNMLGAAIAAGIVSLPLMVKGAQSAFASAPKRLEEVALAHGMTPFETFKSVTLPLATPGLIIAVTLAALRALGEFGATIMFAGYFPGETSTAPLEIFIALQSGEESRAQDLVLLLSAVSIAATVILGYVTHRRDGPMEIRG